MSGNYPSSKNYITVDFDYSTEAYNWCKDMFGHDPTTKFFKRDWFAVNKMFYFKYEEDAAMFILRWL